MRNLGPLGERTLLTWCSQVGLRAQPVTEDRTGWDCLVEFPDQFDELQAPIMLDNAPAAPKCFIQVKATDSPARRLNIKLDNWLRLVLSHLPAFFLVLDFSGDFDVERAYLEHIDAFHIGRVLKRAREVSLAQSKPIRHHKLVLKFGDDAELATPDGPGLKRALLQHAGNDLLQYTAEKRSLVKSLGYEKGNRLAKFDIAIDAEADPQETIVDFLLGLIPKLQVSKADIFDVRFEIAGPTPVESVEGGTISLSRRPLSTQATAYFRAANEATPLVVDLDIIAAGTAYRFVDERYHKVLFRSRFLHFVVNASEPSIETFTLLMPEDDEPISLHDLKQMERLFRMFHGSDGNTIEAEIFVDRHRYARLIAKQSVFVPSPTELLSVIRDATEVSEREGVPMNTLTSLRELFLQRNKLRLAALVRHQGAQVKISFESNGHFSEGRSCATPLIIVLSLGDYQVAIPAAVTGFLQVATSEVDSPQSYSIQGTPLADHPSILARRAHWEDAALSRLLKKYSEELETVHDVVLLPGGDDVFEGTNE